MSKPITTKVNESETSEQDNARSEDTPRKSDRWLVRVLRASALICLAGWWWVHYYFEGPYGVLLWDDWTYELAERFNISWDDFVGTGYNDGLVQTWLARVHWLVLACVVLSVSVRRKARIQLAAFVFLGSGLLIVLSYAKYVSALRQLPMFIEHGGQMLTPLLLVMAVRLGPRHRMTVIVAMIAVVMTFAGHGCYAYGFWPTPGQFYGMTSLILGVEYETANTMLRTAGVLDFVVCVGIFIPYLRCPAAIYAAIWGLATALARPVAGMSWGLNYWGADQYLHEVAIRAPHFMIPLYLFLVWSTRPKEGSLLTNEP